MGKGARRSAFHTPWSRTRNAFSYPSGRNAIPPEPPLRVLIFGAGVLGSLYGARLAEAGNDVAVLARGRRLGELRARGVVLEDVRSGARTATPVRIVSELAPDDPYDVVVVLVRKTQLASVLPPLAASRATPNVLVMVSNPSGPNGSPWVQRLE